MNVPSFMRQHVDFPKSALGHFMQTYYGGRSEVRIRLLPTEIIYTDFKSQYPTGNALMGLQELLLAERIELKSCADDVRDFLSTLVLNQLQHRATWKKLRCIVQVIPDGDILPVRTEYDAAGRTTNIGVNPLTSSIPTWYALLDVIGAVLLTGNVPTIVDAIELIPHGGVPTLPWNLFGRPEYAVDLNQDDLFTRVIELRTDVKQRAKAFAEGTDEHRFNDALQKALKLLANSTSYGVLVEVNADSDTHRKRSVTVHAGQSHKTRVTTVEEPGPYFAGPVGTLIPAAGRLMLTIAERLARDRGIGYVLCDTDSMAFARPDTMSREEFARHVQDIVDWFNPLSPYRTPGPILEIEDINQWNGVPEPLYCIAVSAKRYVLYNRIPDGTFRVRKFSSHATGDLINPPDMASDTPEPCVDDIYDLGGPRWKYDLWYRAIHQIECGNDTVTAAHAVLDVPALNKVTVSTAHLYKTFSKMPGIRPFSFITVLPSLNSAEIFMRDNLDLAAAVEAGEPPGPSRYADLKGITYYAPYAQSIEKIADQIRRSDTHELVKIRHKTLNERLERYFRHPESKSWPPNGVGLLERRQVHVVEHVFIGKESNAIRDDIAEESGDILPSDEPVAYVREGWAQTVAKVGVPKLSAMTGIPRRTLYDLVKKRAVPNRSNRGKLLAAIAELSPSAV